MARSGEPGAGATAGIFGRWAMDEEPGAASPGVSRTVEAAAGAAGEARPLTPEEQAPGLDPAAIQQELDAAQAEVTSQWEDLAEPVTAALVAAVAAALAAGALGSLGSLVVPTGALAGISTALATSMLTLASTAAERAAGELREQGLDLDPGATDAVMLRQRAEATAQLLGQGYAAGAGREALRLAGSDPQVVEQAVRVHLDGLTSSASGGRGFVAEQVARAMFAAEYAGRHATFEQVADSAIKWKAVEDGDGPNRCVPCKDIHDHVYPSLAAAEVDYPAGGYRKCLGGDRCRGRIEPVRS